MSRGTEKCLTPPCLKFTSVGPFEVKAGKGAHKAERPTKVKGIYLCGPIQFMGPFTCFASLMCGPFTSIYGLSVSRGAHMITTVVSFLACI